MQDLLTVVALGIAGGLERRGMFGNAAGGRWSVGTGTGRCSGSRDACCCCWCCIDGLEGVNVKMRILLNEVYPSNE